MTDIAPLSGDIVDQDQARVQAAEQRLGELRRSGTRVAILLAIADEQQDWKILGYKSFNAYATEALEYSKSHAHALLSQGRVLRELDSLHGFPVSERLTGRQASLLAKNPERTIQEYGAALDSGAEPETAIQQTLEVIHRLSDASDSLRTQQSQNKSGPGSPRDTTDQTPPLSEHEPEPPPPPPAPNPPDNGFDYQQRCNEQRRQLTELRGELTKAQTTIAELQTQAETRAKRNSTGEPCICPRCYTAH